MLLSDAVQILICFIGILVAAYCVEFECSYEDN